MNFPTERELVLTSGATTVGVIPAICLVSHFQVGSWPVLYRPQETGNVKRWGLPLMIPNFSRLINGIFVDTGTTLPIHGFGRTLPWDVIEHEATHLAIQLQSSDATRASYPFEFTFTVRIAVGAGTLTYTLTMENQSPTPMPIAPGFHPYFTLAQEDKERLRVSGLPEFMPESSAWDTQPPDNAYPFPHHVEATFPRLGQLTIAELPRHEEQYALASMQVWSEPRERPDHEFVCLEPTVGSEDALNRPADRLTIAPQTSREIVLQLTARPLD